MKPIALDKARRPFTAFRDENGVPQIHADQWRDALYGLGYLHALDRGTQLLFARSVANGTAAADIANHDELVETDRFLRRVGLHLNLDSEVALFDTATNSQLDAYCEGVNDGLHAMGRSWPMWATNFEPSAWTSESVLLIGKLLSFGGLAVGQMQNERILIELIHAGASDDALKELFQNRIDGVDFELIRQLRMSNQLSDEALELLTDLPRLAGSNAWAVSPARTQNGSALLASDPHLEVNRLPAIWYEAVLNWADGQYVMGATLPGCPLFAVARTNRLAWGVTYMKGDTVDYFIEDCRLGGETGWQYRRGEQWRDFRVRSESIARKGVDDAAVDYYENDQGVLDADPNDLGEGYQLSVEWTGNAKGNGKAIQTWLEVIAARETAEAMSIVKECPQPTLCWVFADIDGHIGMQGCGRFPNRGGGQLGLAPAPAWVESNHWDGWISNDLLPSIYDPECCFVATANEEINQPGGPMFVTQTLPDYRKRRADECLAQLESATLDDMQAIQYDVVSLQARDLLAVFLPHLDEGELKQTLADWDCSYAPDNLEASLFLRLYRNVVVQILGSQHGLGFRRMLYLCSRAGYSAMVLSAADRILAQPDSLWWKGADKGELIRAAAAEIDVKAAQPWSAINNFHFTDRFFGNHRVGRILGYNSRRYPMAGCHATLFQGHVLQTAKRESTFAPSYHLVTELSSDEAWTNLPGGPSENRFSKYYKSDLGRWLTGEYKRLAPQRPLEEDSE
jgi:penicillin amidase